LDSNGSHIDRSDLHQQLIQGESQKGISEQSGMPFFVEKMDEQLFVLIV